jgi:hypothetical protein
MFKDHELIVLNKSTLITPTTKLLIQLSINPTIYLATTQNKKGICKSALRSKNKNVSYGKALPSLLTT